MKKQIIVLQSDDAKGINISQIYLKANKNSIDVAVLFKVSYEIMRQSNNPIVKIGIERFRGSYLEISRLLEEYNKPVDFGRNKYHSKIQDIINDGISDRISDLIDFVFVNFVVQRAEKATATDKLMEKIKGLQDDKDKK